MLDHILATARSFENQHGITPNVVCINPNHNAELYRQCRDLFEPGKGLCRGFRLVILPGNRLTHPKAAMLPRQGPCHQAA